MQRIILAFIVLVVIGCGGPGGADHSEGGRCYLKAASRLMYGHTPEANDFYVNQYNEWPKAGKVEWVIDDFGHDNWDLTYCIRWDYNEVVECTIDDHCRCAARYYLNGSRHVEYIDSAGHYRSMKDPYGIYFYYEVD